MVHQSSDEADDEQKFFGNPFLFLCEYIFFFFFFIFLLFQQSDSFLFCLKLKMRKENRIQWTFWRSFNKKQHIAKKAYSGERAHFGGFSVADYCCCRWWCVGTPDMQCLVMVTRGLYKLLENTKSWATQKSSILEVRQLKSQ